MTHPQPDCLVVTDPDTNETIAVETPDDDTARRIAWEAWFAGEPEDHDRMQRFVLQPAHICDGTTWHPPEARLH